MKIAKRILSTLLAVTMLLGALAGLASVSVSAAPATNTVTKYPIENYIKQGYDTPEDKIRSMTKINANEAFELYVDDKSGEVALREIASGNILFTNPYDVASAKGAETTKAELLSQIIIEYSDNKGQAKPLNSYTDAALNGQITVQKIKNGVRVEYAIGREDSRKLVPKQILGDSFDEHILSKLREMVEIGEITQEDYEVFKNSWTEIDLNGMRKLLQLTYLERYGFLEDYATVGADGKPVYPVLYVFNEDIVSASQLLEREGYIKSYCPDYTFEQMDLDHEETKYEAEDVKYPLFKLALEYYLDDNGMYVRLPCNGLRYDMSTYTLDNIMILPYFGAGNNKNAGYVYNDGDALVKTEGYTFFPDGSGALFDYEELNTSTTIEVPGQIYGLDYAYHEIPKHIKYQKAIRYPVYGAVSSEVIHEYTYMDKSGEAVPVRVSNTVKTTEQVKADIDELKNKGFTIISENVGEDANVYNIGYLAIIKQADSFGELKLLHGGSLHSYNTIRNYFNPKPNDTYTLSDAISVAGNTKMTVVSERKYTGNIEIYYEMLCDDKVAAKAKETYPDFTYYETSWFGMAEAYRDHLCDIGVLKVLADKDVEKDIPLYIEVFGALETQQTIATIPVTMMTPLTTFEDVLAMYDDLSAGGAKNINFKMTGFANGGMYYTVPSNLDWENAVGGKDGFKNLVNKANEINQNADKHLGLYPDFDFAYIQKNTLFDAVVLQDDAVKTIDNRYTSYRQYSATQQAFISFYQLAVSPFRYSKFYNQLLSNYDQYGLKSLSIGSLGNILNSDFNEDNPVNREDSKDYTKEAFATMKDKGYSVMTDGGNAYTWAYVDHILDVELDSSRYLESCASVPFIGVVLHGYKQFASMPLNEEGDINYAILRAIENGAGMYFILSKQNTSELKKDSYLSQYYSIQYDIWKSDVLKYYNELNGLLKDVQTKLIVDHKFLVGERVLDDDELQADIAEKLEELEKLEDKIQKEKETAELIAISEAWALAYSASEKMSALKTSLEALNKEIDAAGEYETVIKLDSFMKKYLEELAAWAPLNDQKTALDQQLKDLNDAEEPDEDAIAALEEEIKEFNKTYTPANTSLENAKKDLTNALNSLRDYTSTLLGCAVEIEKIYAEASNFSKSLEEAKELITNTSIYDSDETTRELLLNQVIEGKNTVDAAIPALETLILVYDAYLNEESASYIGKVAVDVQNVIFEKNFAEGGAYAAYADYLSMVNEEFGAIRFDEKDIESMIASDEEDDNEDSEIEDSNDHSYVIDNNKIVLVLYGDRNAVTHEKTASKGFILNYNSYAVRVTYNGITYTVESGGYVVIENPAIQ